MGKNARQCPLRKGVASLTLLPVLDDIHSACSFPYQLHTHPQAIAEGKSNKLIVPAVIDVRDIARAHILAAVTPSASGRFVVSHGSGVTNKMAMDVLAQRFPQFKLLPAEDGPPSKPMMDNSKVSRQLQLYGALA